MCLPSWSLQQEEAINFYDKALSNHRFKDYLVAKQKVRKPHLIFLPMQPPVLYLACLVHVQPPLLVDARPPPNQSSPPPLCFLPMQVQAELKAAKRAAYIDPVKAAEAKATGNEFFKKASYPEAIKASETHTLT